MRLALPAPPGMWPWLAERANVMAGPGFHAIAAIADDGKIAGMVAWDGFTPEACCIHVAVDNPAALRSLLAPGLAHSFMDLERRVLIATVLSTNERSLRLVKHLGFREVMRGRNWWQAGVDMVWFEMTRETYQGLCERKKWLNPSTVRGDNAVREAA